MGFSHNLPLPFSFSLSRPLSFKVRYVLTKNSTGAWNATANGTSVTEADQCVYWLFAGASGQSGSWDTAGCHQVVDASLDPDAVLCECNHLTNFAVLTTSSSQQPSAADADALSVITLVGAAVSVPALLLTAAVFLAYKKLRTIGRLVTTHLCINLSIATLLLVFGTDQTGDRATCADIATLLHFFLLASFAWMLMEGVHLYMTFVVVFATVQTDAAKHMLYAIIAYSIPALVAGGTRGFYGIKGYVR